jgi:hypothetical protein
VSCRWWRTTRASWRSRRPTWRSSSVSTSASVTCASACTSARSTATSCADFEERVEAAIRARFAARNFAIEPPRGKGWIDDNARVIAAARTLAAGTVLVLFQARLQATLAGWRLRGDVDILRL